MHAAIDVTVIKFNNHNVTGLNCWASKKKTTRDDGIAEYWSICAINVTASRLLWGGGGGES